MKDINQIPAIYLYYTGNTKCIEDRIKQEKANALSKYMYEDLYCRNVKLSEDEYKERLAFFDKLLIDQDGEARALFFDTEKGIERLPKDYAEHQIALTIKMFRYNKIDFYAFLIYYYYFKKKIGQEAVINLSFYVMHIAYRKLNERILQISTGTAISIMALKMICPFYDITNPIKELCIALPLSIANSKIKDPQNVESDYDNFKKSIARKRLEMQLNIGPKAFDIKYKFVTILDKLQQIDDYLHELCKHQRSEKDSIEDDDLIFEKGQVKQIQINIPYILQLVKQYHDDNCLDKKIIVKIQKAIGSSPDLRDKQDLIIKFIDRMTLSSVMTTPDHPEINEEWNEYVSQQREAELNAIIKEENLHPIETRKFIEQSFSDGYVNTSEIAITKMLPPMPIGDGVNREEKKKIVLEKLMAFFNKYFNV